MAPEVARVRALLLAAWALAPVGCGRISLEEMVPDSGVAQDAGLSPPPKLLALGDRHSCARRPDGIVRCWGAFDVGQVGDGRMRDQCAAVPCSSPPVPVSGLGRAREIAASAQSTCALLEDGRVSCWGMDDALQLGAGGGFDCNRTPEPVLRVCRPWPKEVTGVTNAGRVAVGDSMACAVLRDGTLWCWGRDFLPGGENREPHAMGLSGVTDVALGRHLFGCVLAAGGALFCGGSNDEGQLGQGSATRSPLGFVAVGALDRVVAAGTGESFACALRDDGEVFCWGANPLGQLGDGTFESSSVPRRVALPSRATRIAAGAAHACAVVEDGGVMCWGSGEYGQLGDGRTNDASPRPVRVHTLQRAVEVAAGAAHACAQLDDDSVWCWGSNAAGQLGDGTRSDRSTPVRVQF